VNLQGFLFKPEGVGRFPAIVYNHGSAAGMLSNDAFEIIAPLFVSRGWVFFAPYRRGQGLSASAGPFIGAEIASARQKALRRTFPVLAVAFVVIAAFLFVITRRKRAWIRATSIALLGALTVSVGYLSGMLAGAATMVRLLETDHLNDQIAAYEWLRQQSFVQSNHIAVAGNSFGGIEAVLGAERLNYCAAIDAAGGAESWTLAPVLRTRMLSAVRNSRVPIFFFQAANDYSLAPSRTLSAAMQDAGKVSELKIYPAFGDSASSGHSFTWLGTSIWADDVFRFLNRHCKN